MNTAFSIARLPLVILYMCDLRKFFPPTLRPQGYSIPKKEKEKKVLRPTRVRKYILQYSKASPILKNFSRF